MKVLMSIPLAVALIVSPAGVAAQESEDKTVCKREPVRHTGSNIPTRARKVCMKESEWKVLSSELQRNLEQIREKSGASDVIPATGATPPS